MSRKINQSEWDALFAWFIANTEKARLLRKTALGAVLGGVPLPEGEDPGDVSESECPLCNPKFDAPSSQERSGSDAASSVTCPTRGLPSVRLGGNGSQCVQHPRGASIHLADAARGNLQNGHAGSSSFVGNSGAAEYRVGQPRSAKAEVIAPAPTNLASVVPTTCNADKGGASVEGPKSRNKAAQ